MPFFTVQFCIVNTYLKTASFSINRVTCRCYGEKHGGICPIMLFCVRRSIRAAQFVIDFRYLSIDKAVPAGAFYSNGLFICKGRGTIAGIFWIQEF